MRALLICILIVFATIEAKSQQAQVEASEREQSPDVARVQAEEALRDALKVMREADKLTDEQVEELFNIVFVGYEAFLKENPDMAKANRRLPTKSTAVFAGTSFKSFIRIP